MRDIKATLLYKWFHDVWNNDNEAAIDNLMSCDVYAHGLIANDQPCGAEAFKGFFRDFRSQFHDVRISVDDVVSQDDMESARNTIHAVHTATGKPVTFSGICMVQKKNGKIAEAWNQYDFLSLYQQIGQKLVAETQA